VAKYQRDLSDPRFNLSPVTDDMSILLHVSPEAGWPVLKAFLEDTNHNRLTIGMYHMTAPHVVNAIEKIAGRAKTKVILTIDRQRGDAANPDDIGDADDDDNKKKDDIPEEQTLDKLEHIAGNRFKWAPASLGAQGLFASAYHIKGAVWGDGDRHASDSAVERQRQSSNQDPIETASQIPRSQRARSGLQSRMARRGHPQGAGRPFAPISSRTSDNQTIARRKRRPGHVRYSGPIGAREEAPRLPGLLTQEDHREIKFSVAHTGQLSGGHAELISKARSAC
jgi:hypothetical protein